MKPGYAVPYTRHPFLSVCIRNELYLLLRGSEEQRVKKTAWRNDMSKETKPNFSVLPGWTAILEIKCAQITCSAMSLGSYNSYWPSCFDVLSAYLPKSGKRKWSPPRQTGAPGREGKLTLCPARGTVGQGAYRLTLVSHLVAHLSASSAWEQAVPGESDSLSSHPFLPYLRILAKFEAV